jgi:hypothetical protein
MGSGYGSMLLTGPSETASDLERKTGFEPATLTLAR